jgi:hypothetical protein
MCAAVSILSRVGDGKRLGRQAFIEAVLCVLSEIFLIVHLPSISGASIDCNLIFSPRPEWYRRQWRS